MKPIQCCNGCLNFDKEKNRIENKFRCNFCEQLFSEALENIHNNLKKKRGCSTCVHCKRVNQYPAFVTAEECECEVGLECDTVLFSVKNCPKWIER